MESQKVCNFVLAFKGKRPLGRVKKSTLTEFNRDKNSTRQREALGNNVTLSFPVKLKTEVLQKRKDALLTESKDK